jgi:hypothetical protein
MKTITPTAQCCGSYLCDNDANGPDRLCNPCRAANRLVVAVNAAVEEFLNDRWPAPRSLTGDRSISPLFDNDNPTRRGIFEAGGDLAHGLVCLVDLAIGKRTAVTSGPWLDPYDGRHGGFGWDISEDVTS